MESTVIKFRLFFDAETDEFTLLVNDVNFNDLIYQADDLSISLQAIERGIVTLNGNQINPKQWMLVDEFKEKMPQSVQKVHFDDLSCSS